MDPIAISECSGGPINLIKCTTDKYTQHKVCYGGRHEVRGGEHVEGRDYKANAGEATRRKEVSFAPGILRFRYAADSEAATSCMEYNSWNATLLCGAAESK